MAWINETLDFLKRLESLKEPDEAATKSLPESDLETICNFIEKAKAEAMRLRIIEIMQKTS